MVAKFVQYHSVRGSYWSVTKVARSTHNVYTSYTNDRGMPEGIMRCSRQRTYAPVHVWRDETDGVYVLLECNGCCWSWRRATEEDRFASASQHNQFALHQDLIVKCPALCPEPKTIKREAARPTARAHSDLTLSFLSKLQQQWIR